MNRLASAAVLLLAVACSTSYEKECVDLCDRVERCVERDDERFEACKTMCEEIEEDGQNRISDGSLEQVCYDAVTDLLSCYNRLDCLELSMVSTSTPARCKDEVKETDAVCEE